MVRTEKHLQDLNKSKYNPGEAALVKLIVDELI